MNASFESAISKYDTKEQEVISFAYEFSERVHEGDKHFSGEPKFVHPLGVAKKLIDWNADYESVVCGLLHDVIEDAGISIEEIIE